MKTNRGRNLAQTIGIDKLYNRQGSFFILKGHYHDRSIKSVSASSQQLNRCCLHELALSDKPCRRTTYSRYHGHTVPLLYGATLYRTAA
jgi:hypothetical protein